MGLFKKEEKKPTVLQDVSNKLDSIINSKTGQKVTAGIHAGLSSLDDAGSFGDLWEDSNGKFDPRALKGSITRSLASSSYANKAYDKALDSRFGSMADQLTRAPMLTLKANRKLGEGATVLRGFKDRSDDRKFQAAKAQTLSGMGQAVNELSTKHRQATQKATGYSAVANAFRTQGNNKFGKKGFDPDYLLEQADKEHYMETGQHLTKEEKQYAWDALKKGYNRGFNKKSLGVVYDSGFRHRKGGLGQRRMQAAADTVGRHAEQVGTRAQMIGGALQQANEKVNKVMEMQGIDKRIRGPKFNIDRFKQNFENIQAQQKAAAENTKKSAADDATLLTALSQTGFATRPIGKTRVLIRKDLDKDGGAERYADALIHSQGMRDDGNYGGVTDNEIMSLKTSLKKLFREREFLDDVDFKL